MVAPYSGPAILGRTFLHVFWASNLEIFRMYLVAINCESRRSEAKYRERVLKNLANELGYELVPVAAATP